MKTLCNVRHACILLALSFVLVPLTLLRSSSGYTGHATGVSTRSNAEVILLANGQETHGGKGGGGDGGGKHNG